MDRGLALFAIGFVFGGGIGFVVAAAQGVTLDGHDHSTGHGVAGMPAAHHASHDRMLDIAPGPSAPTLAVEALRDPVTGWTLHLTVGNFTFAPDKAGLANAPGEGHAHLYRNDVKIARLYGPWVHLAAEPGDSLRVALYSNDHSAIGVDGAPVEVTLAVPQD